LAEKIKEIRLATLAGERVSLRAEKLARIDEFRNEFSNNVNDDLNTAAGLAVLWQVVKSNIPAGDKLDLIYLFDEVLGLKLSQIRKREDLKIPDKITALVAKREEARRNRNFRQADELRKKIEGEGFIVEDLPTGPRVKLQ